jgi:hypothetical protein
MKTMFFVGEKPGKRRHSTTGRSKFDSQGLFTNPGPEKSRFRKLYEGLVGGISGLLQNRSRVRSRDKSADFRSVESPRTGTWETVVRLVQNAFLKAILPGFEKEVSQGGSQCAAKPASNQG